MGREGRASGKTLGQVVAERMVPTIATTAIGGHSRATVDARECLGAGGKRVLDLVGPRTTAIRVRVQELSEAQLLNLSLLLGSCR